MNHLGESLEGMKGRLEAFFESFSKEPNPSSDSLTILISPITLKKLGEILGVNVAREVNQVPNIKTFLRVFLLQYRLDGCVSPEEIESSLDMIMQERIKKRGAVRENIADKFHNELGQSFCVECGLDVERYCVECCEATCCDCCQRLHAKGNRAKHTINSIIKCSLCRNTPARLLCTYTFSSFCRDCYSRRHVKSIPHEMLDLRPVEIDYSLKSSTTNVTSLQQELVENKRDKMQPPQAIMRVCAPGESAVQSESVAVCGNWHPFLDSSGVVYFYNFVTQESMRRANSGISDPSTQERREATRKIATFLSQTI